jgi:hypothetical protein
MSLAASSCTYSDFENAQNKVTVSLKESPKHQLLHFNKYLGLQVTLGVLTDVCGTCPSP